jgi:hypothetical protein
MLFKKNIFIVLVFLFAVAGLSPAAVAQQATPSVVTEVNEAAEKEVVLDPGMQIPVDGSSLEAFNASLETIKAQAEELNYISLENAIQYLLVYDLAANRDRAKLAKNLDGLTGDEIIDRVEWRK